MFKYFLEKLYAGAIACNTENVKKALASTGPHKNLLDVGCWDGEKTLIWAKAAESEQIFGLEPVKTPAKIAKEKGITMFEKSADVGPWPIPNSSIDCIISTEVVEHLSNLDHFFAESFRVLVPGGTLITSTNNLASWHNIFALLLDWAPFDLTNSSQKSLGIGNPLAFNKGVVDKRGGPWTHKCVYTSRWLKEWQSLYGFEIIKVLGAGFYPFPAFLGRFFKKHSAFITLVARKKS